jgi:copper chaperone CopZ
MHCGGCAEAIVAEVSEVPGVAEVRCTFESGTAEILAADADLRGRIEQAITKLGYRIEPLPDGAALPAPGAPDAHHADGAATGALSSR